MVEPASFHGLCWLNQWLSNILTLFFRPDSVFKADFVKPPLVFYSGHLIIWHCPCRSHLVESAVLRSVTESFKAMLYIVRVKVIFDRDIRHVRPYALKTLSLPARPAQHSCSSPCINFKRRRKHLPRWSRILIRENSRNRCAIIPRVILVKNNFRFDWIITGLYFLQ